MSDFPNLHTIRINPNTRRPIPKHLNEIISKYRQRKDTNHHEHVHRTMPLMTIEHLRSQIRPQSRAQHNTTDSEYGNKCRHPRSRFKAILSINLKTLQPPRMQPREGRKKGKNRAKPVKNAHQPQNLNGVPSHNQRITAYVAPYNALSPKTTGTGLFNVITSTPYIIEKSRLGSLAHMPLHGVHLGGFRMLLPPRTPRPSPGPLTAATPTNPTRYRLARAMHTPISAPISRSLVTLQAIGQNLGDQPSQL